jgi:hypothetical protein
LYTGKVVEQLDLSVKSKTRECTLSELVSVGMLAALWQIKDLGNLVIRELYTFYQSNELGGTYFHIVSAAFSNKDTAYDSAMLRFLTMGTIHDSLSANSAEAKQQCFQDDAKAFFGDLVDEGCDLAEMANLYFGQLLLLLKYNKDNDIESDTLRFPPLKEYLEE